MPQKEEIQGLLVRHLSWELVQIVHPGKKLFGHKGWLTLPYYLDQEWLTTVGEHISFEDVQVQCSELPLLNDKWYYLYHGVMNILDQ